MASIRRRGQTWEYAVSHTANGKRKRYTKSGFKTKKEAEVAAIEIEGKLKQEKIPIFINRTSNKKLLDFENSEVLVSEVKKSINKDSDYYLFLLGLTTGMHHGELIDLILHDFGFEVDKSE
jgi:integrase